jgi:hypothetical protein
LFPWRDPLTFKVFSQQAKGAKYPHFDGGDGDAERLGNFPMRLSFYYRENGSNAEANGQPGEGLRGFHADLGTDAWIRREWRRAVLRQFGFRAPRAQPVKSGACGDAPGPGLESASRIESCAGAIDPPKRFYRQIFGFGGIANDAEDPQVDGALMEPESCLERVRIALPEEIQNVRGTIRHPGLSFLTGFTEVAQERLHRFETLV